MPTIAVDGPRIEDTEKRRTLVEALTDAAETAFGLPRDLFVVLLKETPSAHLMHGVMRSLDRCSAGRAEIEWPEAMKELTRGGGD